MSQQNCLYGLMVAVIAVNSTAGLSAPFKVSLPAISFAKATKTCNLLGENWALPNDNLSREYIRYVMSTMNLSSAWMGLERKVEEWTWVNGTKDHRLAKQSQGLHRNCAAFDINDKSLSAVNCADPNTGFVCELPAGKDCSDVRFKQACFSFGEARGIFACRSQNWFSARSFCLGVKGDLAILDNIKKQGKVSNVAADRRLLAMCPLLYTGLNRERWTALEPNGYKRQLLKHHWDVNEPAGSDGMCAQVTSEGLWKVTSCSSAAPVICYNYEPPQLFDPAIKEMPVKTKDTGDLSPWRIVAVALLISIIVVLIATLLLFLLLRAKFPDRLTACLCLEKYSRVSTEMDEHDEKGKTGLPTLKKKNDVISILLFLYKGNGDLKVDKQEYPNTTVHIYDSQPAKEETLKDVHMQICLVNYTTQSPILTKVQSDELLDYLLKSREAVDIAYLPGMELTQTSLSRIQHLRKRVGLFCLAKNDAVGDIAAETIAIGFTETRYGRRNPDIIANGLLDISCTGNMSEPGLGEEVDPRVAHILVLAAKRMWQQKPNLPNNITADLRCHLIDIARGQHQTGVHHPFIGFGLLDVPTTTSDSQESAGPGDSELTSGELVRNTASGKMEEKLVMVLCSTGIDAETPKLKRWEIKPLEEFRRGDEDTARHIGTNSIEIMTDSLTKLGVTPSQVVIYDAHVVKHGWRKDWAHFEHILNMLVEKKPDIVLITSGLGYPDNLKDSSVPELLYDIKEFSVVATSSVLCRPDNVMADFPSDSIISVRVDKDPTTAPACVTGYAKGATVDFVIQGQEVWEGGVRTGAIAAKILIQSRAVGDAIGISQSKLQKTDIMHEILVQLSKGRKSHDEIRLLDNEGILKERIEANLSKYVDAAIKAKRYWAGKNIE